MHFSAKDSVVFSFGGKKYMIDNVKNMRIENGRVFVDGPVSLVYIGESAQYSQGKNNINIISPSVINQKTSYGIQK